jgi:enterochelin esterase family protein
MRMLTMAGVALIVLTAAPSAQQAPPPQATSPAPQPAGRGRGGPPLLPTPPLTAPPTPTANGRFVIGPPYNPAPELTVKDDVPKGTVHEFTMDSKDSKIYPGIARNQPGVVPYTRRVAVYVPAGYKAGTPVPFIVAQDGMSFPYRNNIPPALDTLIHEKRVPAMVAVMVHNGGGDAQGSQRGLEYDTVSGVYTDFIETEVLPRITKDYGVAFTKDPEGRATMGGSSGAACAFTMAWFHPELYRRVLSYSGTYVNQQSPLSPTSPRGPIARPSRFACGCTWASATTATRIRKRRGATGCSPTSAWPPRSRPRATSTSTCMPATRATPPARSSPPRCRGHSSGSGRAIRSEWGGATPGSDRV